jgi:toxin ParE1/3/4
MTYSVLLLQDAEDDIFDIYQYIKSSDSLEAAEHVFCMLEKLCLSLENLPARGHVPIELASINVTMFLEVLHKSTGVDKRKEEKHEENVNNLIKIFSF